MGSSSAPLTATLLNTGTAVLDLSTVQVTGANAGDFSLSNHCGALLAPSAQCLLAVSFSPGGTGTRTAAVVFSDNATGSPQSLSLNGVGAPPPEANLTPSSLSFGSQPVATTSAAQTITLSNSSSATVSIAGLSITGANSGDFAEVADTCGSSLSAGSSCTVGVTFTPSSPGQRTATFSITNSAGANPQSASLTGTGSVDVILSWSASPSAGVVGYNIFRGTTSGGENSTPLNSTPVSNTLYVDTTVTAGTTYYYVLTSVGANGLQSAPSNEAAAEVPAL